MVTTQWNVQMSYYKVLHLKHVNKSYPNTFNLFSKTHLFFHTYNNPTELLKHMRKDVFPWMTRLINLISLESIWNPVHRSTWSPSQSCRLHKVWTFGNVDTWKLHSKLKKCRGGLSQVKNCKCHHLWRVCQESGQRALLLLLYLASPQEPIKIHSTPTKQKYWEFIIQLIWTSE